jgi:hypothetical protein
MAWTVAAVLLATMAPAGVAAAELVMFERRGCAYCARWHEEIGPIYPKTPESRAAPLRRVDLDQSRPDDLAHLAPVGFAPTFVLVEGEREVGRILGYPGQDFFWGLLGELLARLPAGS